MRHFLKNYNEDDVLSKTLMLYFAFQHGAIAAFFIFATEEIRNMSAFRGMASIMPMDAWGIILLISSFSFILTILQEGKWESYFMLTAGVTGMVAFAVMSMASIELAEGQTNTINYIIIASIDIIIAILGGVALWRRKDS